MIVIVYLSLCCILSSVCSYSRQMCRLNDWVYCSFQWFIYLWISHSHFSWKISHLPPKIWNEQPWRGLAWSHLSASSGTIKLQWLQKAHCEALLIHRLISWFKNQSWKIVLPRCLKSSAATDPSSELSWTSLGCIMICVNCTYLLDCLELMDNPTSSDQQVVWRVIWISSSTSIEPLTILSWHQNTPNPDSDLLIFFLPLTNKSTEDEHASDTRPTGRWCQCVNVCSIGKPTRHTHTVDILALALVMHSPHSELAMWTPFRR